MERSQRSVTSADQVRVFSREEEVVADKQLRRDLDEKLQTLKGLPASPERAIAITKLQEAVMWLGMDLARLNEPTADGLRL